MSSTPMTLPETPFMLSRELRFHPEWVMDPPRIFLERFDEKLVREIYRIKMKHLAEVARLEAQIAEIRGAMYAEIAGAMQKGG